MVKDDGGKEMVVWVTDIQPPDKRRQGMIFGRVFRGMRPTWQLELKTKMPDGTTRMDGVLSSAKMYSFLVDNPSTHEETWPADKAIIGKCTPLPICKEFPPSKSAEVPSRNLRMVVTLLHHCVPG